MNMIKKKLSKKSKRSFLGPPAVGPPNNIYWFKFIVIFKLFHLSIFWKKSLLLLLLVNLLAHNIWDFFAVYMNMYNKLC
jgi:hypothetical protein